MGADALWYQLASLLQRGRQEAESFEGSLSELRIVVTQNHKFGASAYYGPLSTRIIAE
jgi:hypothetical protein